MTEALNITKAKATVKYVEGKMTVGAGNKWGDVFSSWLSSPFCVARVRNQPTDNTTYVPFLRSVANNAIKEGCGNCGEQAAIAFIHLLDQKVGPIDYMTRTNADHAFVVIGRTGPVENYAAWGENAVVCDPWHGKSYYAKYAGKEMYGGGVLKPDVFFRWSPS